MKLQEADVIASAVIALLKNCTAQIAVAGGIRRHKLEPHDIEIVCVPLGDVTEQMPLLPGFGSVLSATSPLEQRISELIAEGQIALDRQVRRNGAKYKRLIVQNEVVELFIASRDNYGNILTIRTGDAEFSHALVTPRRAGGLMPSHLVQHGGYLWRGAEKIACPTEMDFFQALGIQWIEPGFRNAANARNLARHVEGK